MELAKKLKENGWHLTEEGIKTLIAAVGSEDAGKVISEALNRDLRDIGGGALSLKRDDTSSLPGRIVLQVQRVRNIAAPKCNEESKAAPRLIQLDLSDGQTSIQALELESVPSLNLNVAPGTKIYFKAEKLQLLQGFLLLRAPDLQLLGGRVEALYEKWDLARTMLKYARSGRPLGGASAPPPWVAFGKKIDSTTDRNFKSLNPMGDKDKVPKENDEFNAMRSEAIATATKAGGKKVFGGGGQNIVDHNIKKILDKGYSEEEARNALHATRNNLERALYNLKRRKDSGNLGELPSGGRGERGGGRGERFGRDSKRGGISKDEAEAAKPAANATLFDFLTNKLPSANDSGGGGEVTASFSGTNPFSSTANGSSFKQYHAGADTKLSTPAAAAAAAASNKFSDRSRFENNVSSSFAAHRGGYSGSSRGGRRDRDRDRPPRGDKDRAGASSYNSTRKSEPPKTSGRENPPKSSSEPKNNLNETERRNNNRGGGGGGGGGGGSSRQENGNRRRQQGSSSSTAGARSQNSTEDFANRLNKVTEETANLKLSAPKRENRRRQGGGGGGGSGLPNRPHLETTSSNQQQTPPPKSEKPQPSQRTPQNPRHNANYSQLPNGYTYDPSKIMGFQSKETNEFAMSLLKSQGVSVANANQTSPVAPEPVTTLPFNARPQPPPPQQFGMLPGDAWLWSKGDLCMAKYWDDGTYYEAEITGVAENTCVVFFLGYGNHEEVLKSDLLPLTDSQNRPLSNISQPSNQQQQQSRFRNDRQAQQNKIYVPPHKREH